MATYSGREFGKVHPIALSRNSGTNVCLNVALGNSKGMCSLPALMQLIIAEALQADIVKMIESQPNLASLIRRVRGGYLKIQGTWMPYEVGT
jgi:hypothetical protein